MINLISTSNSALSKNIAKALKIRILKTRIDLLTNKEMRIQVENTPQAGPVYILQSILTSDNIMEICLIANALKHMNVKKIIAIIPFCSYSRQDKIFVSGGTNAFSCLVNMIKAAGVNEIVTLDIHNQQATKLCKIPIKNLPTTEIFTNMVDDLDRSIIIAPDKGAQLRAKSMSDALGIRLITMKKKRPKSGCIKIEKNPKAKQILGKHCYIVDDILDTGNTICSVANELHKYGALSIVAFISHGLFGKGAFENIKNSKINRLYVTNSLPIKPSCHINKILDASSIIVKYLSGKCYV